MEDRIVAEFEILKRHFPMSSRAERWVRVPNYPLPPGWSVATTDTAFHVRDGYPGAGLYGIYVPSGLLINGERPGSFTDPAPTQPPFGGMWAIFSWEAEQWFAHADPEKGHNFVSWVNGFAKRFQEGK